jgi:AcrR family transcriptional regulator
MNPQHPPGEHQPSLRLKILEAAIALFAEKGYGNTSVREIVGEVGVTKPALYYYFENKEGLFRAILEQAEQKEAAILAEALGSETEFLERLCTLYETLCAGIAENRDLFKLLHAEFWMPPTGAPDFDRSHHPNMLLKAIRQIYDEARMRGEVIEADADAVAYFFLSLLGLAFLRRLSPLREMPPDIPLRVLRLALTGLQKDTAATHKVSTRNRRRPRD